MTIVGREGHFKVSDLEFCPKPSRDIKESFFICYLIIFIRYKLMEMKSSRIIICNKQIKLFKGSLRLYAFSYEIKVGNHQGGHQYPCISILGRNLRYQHVAILQIR